MECNNRDIAQSLLKCNKINGKFALSQKQGWLQYITNAIILVGKLYDLWSIYRSNDGLFWYKLIQNYNTDIIYITI